MKNKRNTWVFFFHKYGKFWSILGGQKVERKTLFFEVWTFIKCNFSRQALYTMSKSIQNENPKLQPNLSAFEVIVHPPNKAKYVWFFIALIFNFGALFASITVWAGELEIENLYPFYQKSIPLIPGPEHSSPIFSYTIFLLILIHILHMNIFGPFWPLPSSLCQQFYAIKFRNFI